VQAQPLPPQVAALPPQQAQPLAPKPAAAAPVAQKTGSTVDQIKTSFARAIYNAVEREINHDRPQAMLRAVVVMKIRLSEEGKWIAEVMRENDLEPSLTKKALASVETLTAPVLDELSDNVRTELRHIGFVEAWLFQTDGHFALKTLALPQKGL